MNIGDRIKKVRKSLDLTQEAFATRIGSVQNTITGYESGRRNPSAPVISLICKEFNVNEEWLRNGTGEMFNPEPCDELDSLADKFNLSHGEYIFLEKYLKLKREVEATKGQVKRRRSRGILQQNFLAASRSRTCGSNREAAG